MHPSPRTPSDAGPEAAAHSPGKGQTGIGEHHDYKCRKDPPPAAPERVISQAVAGYIRAPQRTAAAGGPERLPRWPSSPRSPPPQRRSPSSRRPALGHPPPVQHLAVRSPGRAGHQPVGDERSAGDAAEPASVQDLAHRPSRDRAGLGLRAAAAARPGRGARPEDHRERHVQPRRRNPRRRRQHRARQPVEHGHRPAHHHLEPGQPGLQPRVQPGRQILAGALRRQLAGPKRRRD